MSSVPTRRRKRGRAIDNTPRESPDVYALPDEGEGGEERANSSVRIGNIWIAGAIVSGIIVMWTML